MRLRLNTTLRAALIAAITAVGFTLSQAAAAETQLTVNPTEKTSGNVNISWTGGDATLNSWKLTFDLTVTDGTANDFFNIGRSKGAAQAGWSLGINGTTLRLANGGRNATPVITLSDAFTIGTAQNVTFQFERNVDDEGVSLGTGTFTIIANGQTGTYAVDSLTDTALVSGSKGHIWCNGNPGKQQMTSIVLYQLDDHVVEVPTSNTKTVQKTQQMIRSLPEDLRCCYLCEMEELVFMKDGSIPYRNGGRIEFNANEQIHYKIILSGAMFISLDGQPRDWYGVLANNSSLKNSTWVEIKRGVGKCGKDAVNRPFKKDIQKLKKLFARRNEIMDEIKRGNYNPERYKIAKPRLAQPQNPGSLSKAMSLLKDINNSMARDVLISAITNEQMTAALSEQAYVSPRGEIMYAFEELEKAGALATAAKVLAIMPSTNEARDAISSRYGKCIAAIRRGRELRDLRLDCFSKQLDAAQAAIEADEAETDPSEQGKRAATDALKSLQAINDPVCRTAMAISIANSFSPRDLFENCVVDNKLHCVNCYDIVHRNKAENTLVALMATAARHDEVRMAVVSTYKNEIAAHDKGDQKRASHIKAVLSELEAKEAMEKLKKAEEALEEP